MPEKNRKRIVVAGGGFAGINLIKRLSSNPHYQVVLVDINNYHFFPPLLYQVATAFIEPSNISYPFRRMFQGKENFRFYMGTLQKVNPAEQTIETDSGKLEYDYLVLAVGTESNYFGMKEVSENSWPMKTINDAIHLRNHLLLNMEKAIRAESPVEKEKLLNIVIAGGGPTGVELAGMLAEMGTHIVRKEYPEISILRPKIYLIDAAPVLLGPMSKKSQEEAYKVLTSLGVSIKLNTAVKGYKNGHVLLGDSSSLPTKNLLWTSGVIGREVPGLPAGSIGRGRRILTDEYNRVKGFENIFALGDISLCTHEEKFPNGHPQLAQVAIQQGQLLAENFERLFQGQALKPFVYNDKGSMAIISKYKSVVDLPNLFFKGFGAWIVWLFIHIIPIAGFRNKLKLAFNWFWSFITNNPTLRLIIRPVKEGSKENENG